MRYRLLSFLTVLFAAQATLLPGAIVINEIHYDPDVKTEHVEFVELYNNGTNTVDLSGWYFASGPQFTFPAGTTIAPGGYQVVAQDPAALGAKFGYVGALGPFTNRLSNGGERIALHHADSTKEDEVEYQAGFPWPTVGDAPGYSIELIHPGLDNNLGGSWRASAGLGGPGVTTNTLINNGEIWRYLRGTNEASTPTTLWRRLDFNDASWGTGALPIGYDPAVPMATPLTDMNGNYTTVFLRKQFVVADASLYSSAFIEAMYDDGFKVWINGTNVLNANISTNEVPYYGTAPTREDNSYSTFNLLAPAGYLVTGTNIIAVQLANTSLGSSSDCFLDLRLKLRTGAGGSGPTPGRRNSVYATNAPPQIRQVDHSPSQPRAGEVVKVTAKVTDPDSVLGVVLQYQVVDPGNYIELTDAAYATNWIAVPMRDTGTGGDLVGGDDVYSVDLPASLQTHRRLIRYRIVATDSLGASVRVPYADDPQPNFAYFVYNGIPEWRAALQPGAAGANGTVLTYSSNEMARLQPIHLIARSNTVATATWFSRYGGDAYLWAGTLVYEGKVYDHVHYRARGGVWRYAMTKNMWKFDLNRGHELEARDNWGRKFKTKWNKLNLGACIQQGDYGHRGEQGMFESIGSRLFELAGVAAFKTALATFRVIDDAVENPPANQYASDFWGLYLMVEQEDGHFLDEHGLPDGNLYKMEGGTGELNNVGLNGPTDKSDLNAFLSYGTTEAWWRANLNLQPYYSYQAIIQAIHHYDIADGKNYFYYRNPQTGLWQVIPWDLDLTWADNMYRSGLQGGDEPFKSRVLANFATPGSYPAIGIEFRNRIRELRDLLFNSDQAFQLVDEYARLIRGTDSGPTLADADRAQWDYNPKMADAAYSSSPGKAGQGRFYQWPYEPTVPKSFEGAVQLMKNYINYRSTNPTFSLDTMSADALRPNQPTIAYTGPSNYPINRLTFRSSNFSGVGGLFASMKWRIGEITDTNLASFDPSQPWKYEITPVWESAELAAFNSDLTLPPAGITVGHKYRVRVRMTDTTGRTSNWSPPVEFVAGQADGAADLLNYLRITEVMYNPPPGGYEYIELHNLSATNTLQLAGAKFTAGIDFTFPIGATLAPGGYLVVVGTTNLAAFRAYYGLSTSVPVLGAWSGSLANDGERLTLKTSSGGMEIVSFQYGTGRGWPLTAKGTGHSLVLLESAEVAQGAGAGEYGGNWRASTYLKGSPGSADVTVAPTVVLNEVVSHTDFLSEEDSNDWIELYNLTDAPFTLGPNWYLSDDGADLKKWMIPPATTIPARGWVSFDEQTGFHFPTNTGFGLSKDGEQVFLSYLPGTAQDRVADWLSFKAQENDWAFGRYPDGTGPWYALTPRTRDAANAAPGPHVVINEICFHPPDIGGTNDNGLDEYIEIWNATPNPAALWNAEGNWRLSGDVDYEFPGVALAPDEYLLLVHFDPVANPTQLAVFRSLYGITNLNLRILGPYSGKLPNSSGRIALEKPQAPDIAGNPVGWVLVDEVLYADQGPWPAGADGSGASLQRLSAAAHGSEPGNWTAQSPSAGAANSMPSTDSDGDGLPDWWENANGLNPMNPADALIDLDGDGMNSLQEYLAGTNPRDRLSYLKLEAPVLLPALNGVVIRFNAVSKRSYTLQVKAGLAAGGWSNVASFDARATNTTVVLTNSVSPGSGSRFYRLVTPRQP